MAVEASIECDGRNGEVNDRERRPYSQRSSLQVLSLSLSLSLSLKIDRFLIFQNNLVCDSCTPCFVGRVRVRNSELCSSLMVNIFSVDVKIQILFE